MRRQTALLGVQIHDGDGQGLTKPFEPIHVTLRDGYQRVLHRRAHASPEIDYTVPYRNSFADKFTVLAWQKGTRQTGFYPIHVDPRERRDVKLMLVPDRPLYDFGGAGWQVISQTADYSWIAHSFRFDPTAYTQIASQHGATPATNKLATLLNVTEAVRTIDAKGSGPLFQWFDRLYDQPTGPLSGFQEDRTFVWVGKEVFDAIANHGQFEEAGKSDHRLPDNAVEPLVSYKQTLAGEANVQFTFYEPPTGAQHWVVELDMDYYRDRTSHFLLEYVPHKLAERGVNLLEERTDPSRIYAMRWTADANGGRVFQPLYTLARA